MAEQHTHTTEAHAISCHTLLHSLTFITVRDEQIDSVGDQYSTIHKLLIWYWFLYIDTVANPNINLIIAEI